MDLHDYLRLLRRRWKLVALCTLVAIAAASAATYTRTKIYTATSKLFVSTTSTSSADANNAYAGALLTQQRVKSYVDIISSVREAQLVIADLDLSIPASVVADKISASAPLDEVVINVSVSDPDPGQAQRLAEAVGRTFPDLVDEIERPVGGVSPVRVSVVQPPGLPTEPTSPRPNLNLALGLLIGLAVGIGGAVLRETFDTRVRTREAVEALVGAPALGLLPRDPQSVKRPLVVAVDPRSPHAESFRQLRTNLQFVDVEHHLSSVVVTSALLGEGKSTTACNLALAIAEAGSRVVLVEGDLRRPRVDEYLGLEGAIGLTSVLLGSVPLEVALQPWGDKGLRVLSSGPLPPNPSELLGSTAMQTLLGQLEELADLVIIDAPPVLPVTDAAVLGAMASGVVLVVDASKTRRDAVRHAADQVRAVGATLLGSVLTQMPTKGPEAYGYGREYGYGVSSATEATTPAAMPPAPQVSVNGAGRAAIPESSAQEARRDVEESVPER